MIKCSEMLPRLIAACPSFTEKWEAHKREYFEQEGFLPYVALMEFNAHLVDLFTRGSIGEFSAVFTEIEQLHLIGEAYVKEAATIGLLEGLQNIMGNHGMDPEILRGFLGSESAKWWDEVNKFYNGEISYIGETIDSNVRTKRALSGNNFGAQQEPS